MRKSATKPKDPANQDVIQRKKPIGRHAKPYNKEIGDAICKRLATTDLALSEVLDEMNRPISEATFYVWCVDNPIFAEQSARARECQGTYLADRAMIAARTPLIGKMKKTGPKGDYETIADNVERSKLICQMYMKRAGQLNKALSDKLSVCGDADNPVELVVKHIGGEISGTK